MDFPKPLTCSEVGRELLKALLHRELTAEIEDRVLTHLRGCPRCLSVMATVLDDLCLTVPTEGAGKLDPSRGRDPSGLPS